MAPAQIVNKPMDTRQPALTISKKAMEDAAGEEAAHIAPQTRTPSQVGPILKGLLSHDENGVVTWKGHWGMKESDFNDENAASLEPFLYQRQSLLDLESDSINNEDKRDKKNGKASKSTAAEKKSEALARDGRFSGHFYVKRSPGMFSPRQSRTVRSQEKNLIIRFVKSPKLEHYHVLGSGKNRFGKFTLEGTFESKTGQMDLVRVYAPRVNRFMNSSRVKRELQDLDMGFNHQDTIVSKVITGAGADSTLSIRKGKRVRKASARVKGIFNENIHFKKAVVNGEEKKIEQISTVLKKIMDEDHDKWFCIPVDAKALGLKDYHEIVEKPMDLGTIEKRLRINYYNTADGLKADIELTFQNALHYNQRGQPVYKKAESLLKAFMTEHSKLQTHLRDRTNELTRKSSNSSTDNANACKKIGKRSRVPKAALEPSDDEEKKHENKKQKTAVNKPIKKTRVPTSPTPRKTSVTTPTDKQRKEVKKLREKVKILSQHLKRMGSAISITKLDSEPERESGGQDLTPQPQPSDAILGGRERVNSFADLNDSSQPEGVFSLSQLSNSKVETKFMVDIDPLAPDGGFELDMEGENFNELEDFGFL
mmetsp:Transcript_16095/g.20617  ORF Transcript_16095/g.20617 Transcript_16095/m.20617 type:complete len:595 (-) Transcript_16095:1281-3065(-)